METARHQDLCWCLDNAALASREGHRPWRSRRRVPTSPLARYWCSCLLQWSLGVLRTEAFGLRSDFSIHESKDCIRLESAIRCRRRRRSGPPLLTSAAVTCLDRLFSLSLLSPVWTIFSRCRLFSSFRNLTSRGVSVKRLLFVFKLDTLPSILLSRPCALVMSVLQVSSTSLSG